MTALVILPGLDGVGSLRTAFVGALATGVSPVLVSYPPDQVLGYAELRERVESILAGHERYVLLGESFSGPLACMLAARKPEGLVGLILCATFADSPRPLYRWLSPLIGWIPFHGVPRFALSWLLFGTWSGSAPSRELEHALDSVAQPVLRKRAVEAVSVDVTSQLGHIGVPVLCLCARSDRVVARATSERMRAHLPRAEVITVNGPHSLLQAAPGACAAHVSRFLAALAVR